MKEDPEANIKSGDRLYLFIMLILDANDQQVLTHEHRLLGKIMQEVLFIYFKNRSATSLLCHVKVNLASTFQSKTCLIVNTTKTVKPGGKE